MKPRQNHFPLQANWPLKGLNTLLPPNALDSAYNTAGLNVLIRDGYAKRREGYSDFGSLGGSGQLMAIRDFEDTSGLRHLVAATTSNQYSYDSSSGSWTDITTAGGSWSGNEYNHIQTAVGLDATSKRIFLVNDLDTPVEWDGSGLFTDVTWNLTNFVTCKAIAVYKDYLVLGNIRTSEREPQLIAWSDTADFDEFNTGNSGIATIADIIGSIQAMVPLGDRLIIYTTDSIAAMSFVGGSILFSFETILQNTSMISPTAIVNLGYAHLFAGGENIYLFDGTNNLVPIADGIKNTYRDTLDVSQASKAHVIHDPLKREVYWFIPNSSTTYKVFHMGYDVQNLTNPQWAILEYADILRASGIFVQDQSLRWNSAELVGQVWSTELYSWSSTRRASTVPDLVFGSSTGDVFKVDSADTDDDGTAINSYWDSIDFTVPESFMSVNARWIEIEAELKGTEVDVQISLDSGATYTTVTSGQALTSSFTTYKFFCDKVSRKMRVRLKHSSNDFELRWLRVWGREGSPR